MVKIGKKVKNEGLRMGMKAMGKLMEDPNRAEKIMKAFQTVQTTRERMDEATAQVLHFGHLPSRDDVKKLSRQAGKLKRKSKKILSTLDKLSKKLEQDT